MSFSATVPSSSNGSKTPAVNASSVRQRAEDMYREREEMANICKRFIVHTFNVSDMLPPGIPYTSFSRKLIPPPRKLELYVAYIMHYTRSNNVVAYAALALLSRMKDQHRVLLSKTGIGAGHSLFTVAHLIASKIIDDQSLYTKDYAKLAQGLLTDEELKQLERDIYAYLDYRLQFSPEGLETFAGDVRSTFSIPPPYSLRVNIVYKDFFINQSEELKKKDEPNTTPRRRKLPPTPQYSSVQQLPSSYAHPAVTKPPNVRLPSDAFSDRKRPRRRRTHSAATPINTSKLISQQTKKQHVQPLPRFIVPPYEIFSRYPFMPGSYFPYIPAIDEPKEPPSSQTRLMSKSASHLPLPKDEPQESHDVVSSFKKLFEFGKSLF